MTELDFEQIQLIPKFPFLKVDKHRTHKKHPPTIMCNSPYFNILKNIYLNIYYLFLAALGLSCAMWDLHCGMWDL